MFAFTFQFSYEYLSRIYLLSERFFLRCAAVARNHFFAMVQAEILTGLYVLRPLLTSFHIIHHAIASHEHVEVSSLITSYCIIPRRISDRLTFKYGGCLRSNCRVVDHSEILFRNSESLKLLARQGRAAWSQL